MKELTTEQKAKAYDEALSVARKTHQTQPMYRDWLEKMFPELAESENERIRKAIISAIKEDWPGHADWIAWIEKQCEKPQRIVSAEAKEAMYDKPAPLRTGAIGFDGEPMESKPCEQKPAEQCDTNKEFSEAVSEKIRNMVSRLFKGDGNITSKEFADQFACELLTLARYEIQKEQKPADKVEPKFKVGDWVCHTVYKKPLLIVEDLGEGDFRTEPKSIITAKEFREDFYRLWTIQDAKDGDVLVDSLGNVCIYQEPSTKLMYHSYCYGNHKCFIDMGGSHVIVGSSPATKEQRDILFQKMKEAGYEWDAEKKELKKIEQKPAWSEEDGRLFQIVIDILDRENHLGNISHTDLIACVRKLKSLKDRVVPQQQEWSEEDKNYYDIIIAILENTKDDAQLSDSQISFLKSLRPQSQWKPSDEQMKILNEVLYFAANHESPHWNDYIFGTLNNFIRQLKKLMEE